jgi:HK97 family phage portal protein
MGFWSTLINRRSVSNDISDPRFWATDLYGGGITRSGTFVSPESAMKVSTVFACTSLLASVMASLPLQLFKWRKSGGQDPAEDHYLYDKLYMNPNSEQNSYEFREMIQGHLCLRGNGFSYKEMDSSGRINSLIPLHPSRVTPKRERGILWYDYSPNKDAEVSGGDLPGIIRFPADWIWHIKTASLDGLAGMSIISQARETIGAAKGMDDFGADFFGNKPIPGLIVKNKKTLSPVAKENLRTALQRFASDRRHSAMVLEEDMTVESLGMTNQDSQFLEAKSFSVEDICRFFNVPPFLVHHQRDKASTFASAEQLSLNFVVFSLVAPWVARWESSLAKSLLTERERSKYFFKFNVNALLRGDYKTRMQGYALGRQWGIFSPNDCRELEDMNPRTGGDEYIDDPKNITGNTPKAKPVNGAGDTPVIDVAAPKGGADVNQNE